MDDTNAVVHAMAQADLDGWMSEQRARYEENRNLAHDLSSDRWRMEREARLAAQRYAVVLDEERDVSRGASGVFRLAYRQYRHAGMSRSDALRFAHETEARVLRP